ncbi:MAG: tripartite tricarboxylate transporter substrate binding protein [Burkholderiales bacterium]
MKRMTTPTTGLATRRGVIAAAAIGLGVGAGLGSTRVFAQGQPAWPERPLRLVVPFPPGGPVDAVARVVAPRLAASLGQPVTVENRAGAGGIVGAEHAARAPADGYTVFVCSIGHAVLPSLNAKLPYDFARDFVPVSMGAIFPIVVVAHPSVPVTSLADLAAYAKANPGKLSFGSAGNGGGTHLAGELFKTLTGTDLVHVPYKGSAPAMTDVLGGQIQLMFADAPTAVPQVTAGKVKALGVAQAARSPLLPEVPSAGEAGLPGYDAYSWSGFLVPTGTPAEVVRRLNAEIVKALGAPEAREALLARGAEPRAGTPEAFAGFVKAEMEKWGRVVRVNGIKGD